MGLTTDILKLIRGDRGGNDTVESIQLAIDRMVAERNAANNALIAGGGRRRELLVSDAPDKKIDDLDRELDGHRLTLERLELLEGDLLGRLQVCRSERKRAQWGVFFERHNAAAAEHVKTMRAAIAAYLALAAITDEARAAGFEHESVAAFTPPINILNVAAIANFEAEVERVADAFAGRTAPMPVQPVRKPFVPPEPPPPNAGTPRRVSLADREPIAERKPRERRIDKAKPGERLVQIMRAGFEAPDGAQCGYDDVISLPVKQAEMVVKNGAGEFFEGDAT